MSNIPVVRRGRTPSEDIVQIANDGRLNENTRRRRLAARQSLAAFDVLAAVELPVSLDVDGYRITVHRVILVDADKQHLAYRGSQAPTPWQAAPGVNVWCEVWRDGVRIDCDPTDGRDSLDHFHWPNPRLLVPDPSGDVERPDPEGGTRRLREDPGAIILQRIVDAARAIDAGRAL